MRFEGDRPVYDSPSTTPAITSALLLAGDSTRVMSGDVYHCTIANVDPGARFARADGSTREEAESRAIEKATRYLQQTRKFPV